MFTIEAIRPICLNMRPLEMHVSGPESWILNLDLFFRWMWLR